MPETPNPTDQLVEYKRSLWNLYGKSIIATTQEAFPDHSNPTENLLGQTDNLICYPNLETAFTTKETTIAMLLNGNDEVIGYSFAMPIGTFDQERITESEETAYIYFTAFRKEYQGKKLVGPLNYELFDQLHRKGFRFIEEDVGIEQNYAKKVNHHYEKYASIKSQRDHTDFPEFGSQTHFRINLDTYINARALENSHPFSYEDSPDGSKILLEGFRLLVV